MCFSKKRITVLLGAGAPLSLKTQEGFFPSTKNITNEVLKEPYEFFDFKTRKKVKGSLIKEIYNRSCKEYHPALDPNDSNSAAKVHFEIIFYILEMLETYERSWQKGTDSQYVNKFAPFVLLNNFRFDKNEFFSASRHLIDTIIKCVRKYDDEFSSEENDWYRDFWRKNKKRWDLFNLNYDTTIEQSIGAYEDGYEDIIDQDGFQRFNIKKLLKNKKRLSTINHMHGCLLYGGSRYKDINHDVHDYDHQDMYKWPDVETAYKKWYGSSSSSGTAQDGSMIVQGPIITGLAKTDKVTCLPYDGYRNNFFNCVVQNRGLLVAGYSFCDLYINQMFYRMCQAHGDKTRVVLIDYWDIKGFYTNNEADEDSGHVLKDEDLRPRYFERYFSFEYGNEEMLRFIQRVTRCNSDVWKHFDRLSLTEPMVSKNGRLMLFIGGFKYAIENHGDDIIRFLRSEVKCVG